MNAKRLLRQLAPPLLVDLARTLSARGKRPFIEWEHIPEGWAYADAHPEVQGWNVPDVLRVYARKWPEFVALVEGSGPLGVAHEATVITDGDIHSHNTIMAFGYAVARAALGLESLSLLDWGGGIGHYYLLAKSLLPGVRIDYHCKDVPLLAEYGAELHPDQHFCADESWLKRTYDFVMASTSMHYAKDWRGLLADLARTTRLYLYIAQLPTVMQAASFVFVQRPYDYGYNTEYLGWCLNREEFLAHAERAGLRLVREFVYGYHPLIHQAPEQNEYRGYLFQPVSQSQAFFS